MVMTQNLASLTLFKFSSHRRHIAAAATAATDIDGAATVAFKRDVGMTARASVCVFSGTGGGGGGRFYLPERIMD